MTAPDADVKELFRQLAVTGNTPDQFAALSHGTSRMPHFYCESGIPRL